MRRVHACIAGWSRRVAVEAFAVNIRDAAAPDVAGLVNPLLQRCNAGGCHYSVFGLPAVQAGACFLESTGCERSSCMC